jgi:hypothetical protein
MLLRWRWKNSIETDIKEINYGNLAWIYLAQVGVQRLVPVKKKVTKICIFSTAGEFLDRFD